MNNKYFVVARWIYNYDGDRIEIFNGLGACHMSINGSICDMKEGYAINCANLVGELPNGKRVEAKYTNRTNPKCAVFVEGKLLMPESES